MSFFKDKTGDRYGKLVVLKRNEENNKKWDCICDCGNPTTVQNGHLTTGHTQSCGCLVKEKAGQYKKEYNEYDLTGEYGVGRDASGNIFTFSLNKYDLIKDFYIRKNTLGYFYISGKEKQGETIHRIVMGLKKGDGMVVDHINHDKSDNRDENLRICTQKENSYNHKAHKISKSGIVGVHWSENRKRWIVQLKRNRKNMHYSSHIDLEDAIIARKEAELKYFGEFALNRQE